MLAIGRPMGRIAGSRARRTSCTVATTVRFGRAVDVEQPHVLALAALHQGRTGSASPPAISACSERHGLRRRGMRRQQQPAASGACVMPCRCAQVCRAHCRSSCNADGAPCTSWHRAAASSNSSQTRKRRSSTRRTAARGSAGRRCRARPASCSKLHHAAVLDHHALGQPGGAGGVDHVGQVRRLQPDGAGARVALGRAGPRALRPGASSSTSTVQPAPASTCPRSVSCVSSTDRRAVCSMCASRSLG